MLKSTIWSIQMSRSTKRLSILLESEITELYSPPIMSSQQKEVFFSLNDLERDKFEGLRDRYSKIYFILFMGYFKVKPIVLNVGFSQIKNDFHYIANQFFPSQKFRQKNLSAKQKSRIYQNIFLLLGYHKFNKISAKKLEREALRVSAISIDPRFILDESIHFLSYNKTCIPSYTTLQEIVSCVVISAKKKPIAF